jgi:hypothetical protein
MKRRRYKGMTCQGAQTTRANISVTQMLYETLQPNISPFIHLSFSDLLELLLKELTKMDGAPMRIVLS